MARHLPYRWGARRDDRDLLFHVWGHTPGVHELSPYLTINSQTEEPYFRYKGGDASLSGWPAWDYGVDLDYNAGTAPDFNVKGPGLGSSDLGVGFKGSGGAYYLDELGVLDFSTEDLLLEVILKHKSLTGQSNIMGTTLTSSAGWMLYSYYTDHRLFFRAYDGDPANLSAYPPNGQYLHVFVAWDRDEDSNYSALYYLNGTLVDDANFYIVEDISGGNNFYIGGIGTYVTEASFFYAACWKKSNWLPGGASNRTVIDAIAAERFYRWSGTWPTKAVGTWAPTVATRAFGAYMENQDLASPYTKRIYQVRSEHLRVQRAMVDGVPFIGFRAEPQTTNLISESEDLATTWAATRATISQDVIDTPDGDGRTVVDGIVATVDDDTHYIEITPPFAAGTQYASFFIKANDVDWVKVESTVSGGYAYFDLVNKVVGNTSGMTAYIDDILDDDWCHCIVREVWVVTDALRIMPVYDDGDDDFAGDGSTVSVYVWGVQAEDNNSHTSLINTDAATATRLGDQLRYKGDDGNLPLTSGRATFKILFPEPVTDVTTTVVPLLSLSDGGSVDDRIEVAFIDAEFSIMAVISAASGGSAGQAALGGDPRDGEIHNVEIRWKEDYLAIAVDGVWSIADTDVDIPDDLDRIEPLQAHDGTVAAGVLISDLRIMKW